MNTDRIRPYRTWIIAALALLAAFAAYWALRSPPTPQDVTSTAGRERKVLYWHDPMVPGYRSDKPGKSPFMDMDLVPVYQGDDAAGVITIRPEVVNNLGVRTHTVARGAFRQAVQAEGYLLREAGGMAVALDIFGHDALWLRAGLPAKASVYAAAGREYDAVVQAVQGDIDVGGRTLRVRLRLLAADAALRPNLAARVTILAPPARDALAIPREALIRTGTRTAVVLALDQGSFQPADVVAGRESGEWIEIVKGLKEGDRVVVSGQFLIDSEASVRASFARMTPATPPPAAPAADPHAAHRLPPAATPARPDAARPAEAKP